jgi:S1-C subfamily serine protease
VTIAEVSADSPAEKGGLKVGDLITLLGGRKVATGVEFMESITDHKPGDDVEILVEREGKELKLRVKLASRPEPQREDTARMGSVYLGTMPDYAAMSEPGMKLQGVSEGSPAEKGGLKSGDIIVQLGDKKVGTIYDYMEALAAHKPGDEIDVTVKRDGKDVTLRVKLGSRPGR